ncbi:MAG: sugar phosphate isomerase/epimerase [Candidatus Latescibacterota bacterium]|jgi:sugar phosphate isomerase/epimerase
MKIGLCAWSFTGSHKEAGRAIDPHTPEGLTQLALDNGLASVEFASGSLQNRSAEEIAAFRESLGGIDLFLDTGGANYAEDISPLREAIETAHRTGALVVRTTISRLLEGDRREYGAAGMRDYLSALVEPFKQVMPLAEEYGIPVGIENHQDVCSWELIELCERVGSPQLGVTMDVANALAVGEAPSAFAQRVLPILKHVHFKDYTIHPTSSGYRFKRCALGEGVVDWPDMVALFEKGAPDVQGCIELGAAQARHVRILENDYWSTFAARPQDEVLNAIRTLHQAARPANEDWRTPHEREESADARADYELEQFARTIHYIKENL